MKYGLGARGAKLEIDHPIKRYEHPTLETFKKVFEALDERGIHLTRLQWVGWRFLGFLSGIAPSDWSSTFPALINGVTIGYLFGEEAIEEKTLRIKVPSGRWSDDAVYGDKLRPGVVFAGKVGMSESELLTTSGVCVLNHLPAKNTSHVRPMDSLAGKVPRSTIQAQPRREWETS